MGGERRAFNAPFNLGFSPLPKGGGQLTASGKF
jgi:hypothetical protein